MLQECGRLKYRDQIKRCASSRYLKAIILTMLQKPFLPRELYKTMAQDFAEAQKPDWDNISDDVFYRAPGVKGDREKKPEEMTQIEKEAYLSLENCAKACDAETKCYQYLYSDKVCSFAWSFRIGRKRKGSTSGWPLERISKFQKSKTCWRTKWL